MSILRSCYISLYHCLLCTVTTGSDGSDTSAGADMVQTHGADGADMVQTHGVVPSL